MAKDTTEQRAVAFLESELVKSVYVSSLITKNDKTPSWDGDILLYKSESHEKKNLKGNIPVQVKGDTVAKFTSGCSHSFYWSDLENYYNDKGCLYFVVQIHEKTLEYRIFYKELPLLELKNLLEAHPKPRGAESISLQLSAFPIDIKERESLLFSFYSDMEKQQGIRYIKELPSIADFKGKRIVAEITAFGAKGKDPFEILTKDGVYMYAETENGLLPFKEGKMRPQLDGEQDQRVTVDGEEFYDTITTHYENGEKVYWVGESFQFKIEEEKLSYRVRLSNSLRHRVEDLRFLVVALEHGSFNIGEKFVFELSGLASEDKYLRDWRTSYQLLYLYEQVLDTLGVKDDLQLDKLTDQHRADMAKLFRLILHSEWYYPREKLDAFFTCQIGNLNLLMVCKEEYCKIKNSEDVYYRYKFMPPIEKHMPSFLRKHKLTLISYVAHFHVDKLTEISNLGWDGLVAEYEKYYRAKPTYERQVALEDSVIMLREYDKKKNAKFLQYILMICEWVEQKSKRINDRHIAIINRLQTVKRQRLLTSAEEDELARIANESRYVFVKYEANLLLDDMANARYWYNQMEKEMQELLDRQPISWFKKF